MTKRLRTTGPALKTVRDTGPSLRRVEPRDVEAALGAEAATTSLGEALAPITLFAVREEIVRRLQSTGGRPALIGAGRRTKIPLGDEEWRQLEKLAAAIASPEATPTAGQVASVLLKLSAHSVVAQVGNSASQSSRLARELASRATAG